MAYWWYCEGKRIMYLYCLSSWDYNAAYSDFILSHSLEYDKETFNSHIIECFPDLLKFARKNNFYERYGVIWTYNTIVELQRLMVQRFGYEIINFTSEFKYKDFRVLCEENIR